MVVVKTRKKMRKTPAFSALLGFLGSLLCFVAVSCASGPAPSTGGVALEERFGIDGRSCGRGLSVIMTDYASTNVALMNLEGETLSSSFISSASAETKLNAPLSGDVVFPTSRMENELVLIDGLHISVLSFVEITSAKVRAQLSVRTGFSANPQDYLALDDGRALVSRLESNPRVGSEEYDAGDDLVWVDPERPSVIGRIDLSGAQEGERARPSSMALVRGMVFVTLSGHSADFSEAPEARLVAIDPKNGEILFTQVVEGVKNCKGLAVSPDEKQLALSCSGLLTEEANAAAPPNSAVVVLSLNEEGTKLSEIARLSTDDLQRGPFGFSIDYASAERLLVGTFGALEGDDAGRPDSILSYEIATGKVEVLIESKAEAFNLGDIQCMEACGVCFVADAERNLIHRFALDKEGEFGASTHVIETDIALPPRLLGWF